jgi:hypothetical protein
MRSRQIHIKNTTQQTQRGIRNQIAKKKKRYVTWQFLTNSEPS